MKKTMFNFFAIACVALGMASCSSSSDKDQPITTFTGTYSGQLSVTLENEGEKDAEFPAVSERVYIEQGSNETELIISLKDFAFGEFKLGDIIVATTAEIKGKRCDFEGIKDITFENIGICTVKIDGEIKNNILDLDIDVDPKDLPFTVDVDFKGSKMFATDFYPKMTFEEWVVQNPAVDPENQYSFPKGEGDYFWGSSDGGVATLVGMGRADRFTVTATADAVNGKAARIETIDTKGYAGFLGFPATPKVTSGSLFLGNFKLDFKNPLKSTKFGIPFKFEPVAVKGFYKYTPGEVYYTCKDPVKSNIVEVDDSKVDECAINAILYEVSSFDAADEILTGVDIYTSDAVVAVAKLADGTEKKEYTPFEIKFDFVSGKAFDKSKKYRLAVIFSSSKDGDKFSGAPGSVLFVDEVEILTK